MRELIKKRFLRTYAAAGTLVLAVAAAPAVQADNLTDAMIGAYQSSGLLEQNRALLRVADEDVAQSLAALRPVVTTALSISHQYTRTGTAAGRSSDTENTTAGLSVNLNWLLFDNGASRLQTAAAQEAVLATRQALVNVEQQVLYAAVDAYVTVFTQQEIVSLRQNNLRLLQEELRAANDRFEVGEVTRSDVALAESQLAEARANLIDAQGNLVTAQAIYKEIVGHAPGTIASYPPLPRHTNDLTAAEAAALRNHPTLLSQQHSVKAASLTADSSLRAMGPTLNANASAVQTERHGTRANTATSSVALSLNQTLYSGGAQAAARRADLARLDAERGALITTQRTVSRAVASAFTSFNTSQASLSSSNERVRAAQVAFDGIREEATLGSRTTLDVLQAEQELLDAQTARLQARANQALAAYDLLQAQGQLTAEALNLAVERYDPQLYYNQVRSAPAFVSRQGQELDRVLKALNKN